MRRLYLAFSLGLTALPFLFVAIPPCVDLPQQLAQMRLLQELSGGAYEVQWLTPYGLAYLPLWLLWQVFPPLVAGRLWMLLVALLVVTALHHVAWRRGRAPEAALLGGLLVFSAPLYWGFLSFLLGLALFLVWVAEEDRGPASTLGLAVLLYFAHALWLGAALAWLVVRMAWRRKVAWQELAAVAPVVVLAAWRAGAFHDPRFPMAPLWLEWPVGRITGVVDAALGGLRSPVEIVVVAVVALWIALGWRDRARELAGAGALLVIAWLFLPDRFVNTIWLAQRWMPPALMLLVVGTLPKFRLRREAVFAVALGFIAVTASSWHAHDEELDGLSPALAALPARPRLLGLDYIRGSAYFKPPIGMQHFAYGQVLRGGTLNFTFAEHAASLVHLRRHEEPPWTPGLEWYPKQLQPADLRYFDHVLVHASDDMHAAFARLLDPVTTTGPWRLYRVR